MVHFKIWCSKCGKYHWYNRKTIRKSLKTRNALCKTGSESNEYRNEGNGSLL